MTTDRITTIIGAVAAFLLQVLLAPHIAVFPAVPDFMAAYCLAVVIARSGAGVPALPFVMGLAYDLVSGGPVGAMAFSLTAVSALGAWMHRRADNDTAFMAIAVLAASVLLVELAYGLFFLLFGYAAGFADALAYRILPCFLYDLALALVLYLVAVRFLNRDTVLRSEIKQL